MQWVPVAGPSAIRDEDVNNPTVGCVHGDELYVGFNFEFGEGVRLFKCSEALSWTELPLPVDDINRCMALVSGNNSLYMVFTKLADHQTYAARLDAMGWTMSGASPWEQIWPGVLFHAGSLHIVGGKLQDQTLIKRSTSLTADLQHWSSTEELVVNTDTITATFPALPHEVSFPCIVVTHCEDTIYLARCSPLSGNNSVYQLSKSELQLTWKKSTLPCLPWGTGCASYLNWLWVAGGTSQRMVLGYRLCLATAGCVQQTSGEEIPLPSLPLRKADASVLVYAGKLMVLGGQTRKFHSDIFSLDLTPWPMHDVTSSFLFEVRDSRDEPLLLLSDVHNYIPAGFVPLAQPLAIIANNAN